MVVDANLGANKVNRFLEREVFYQATIDKDGFVNSKVEIVYKNHSETESWPQGKYVNWLRLFTPQGVSLVSVSNGGDEDLKKVTQEPFLDFNAFATLVEVPINSEKKVIFSYKSTRPIAISSEGGAYKLLIQKQPGVIADKLNLEVGFPGYLKAKNVSPFAEVSTQVARFETDLAKDREFLIDFEGV